MESVTVHGTLLLLFLLLLLLSSFSTTLDASAADNSQKHKPIVETVDISNVEIPVRVFRGKKAVDGLNKKDFQLFENGKPKPVNGFYITRRKIEDRTTVKPVKTKASKPAAPRLFVLIFNLSHYRQDLTSQLDVLFERIIRPNDRVMVITNHFFLPEWKITGKESLKQKITELLEKEVDQLKLELTSIDLELKALASSTKSRLVNQVGGANNIIQIFKEFFLNYQFLLEDIKHQYLKLPLDQHIKIAEYLKGQKCEKWVLNFYQLGRLPMLDQFGEINLYLQKILDASSKGELKKIIQPLYFDFINDMSEVDDIFMNDICKAFLNSGATFHTLLVKPATHAFSEDYKYRTVTTDSETILKRIARLTGGTVLNSNKIDDFIDDITVREDVVYMLSYTPSDKKKNKLKIKLKNSSGCRLVYDDLKRKTHFREQLAKLTRGKKDIEIASIKCSGDILTVKLDNIELVTYEGERFGAVQARVKILAGKKKLVNGFVKTYKGIKPGGVFQAKLPPLPKGKYNIILEVRDLFSLKNVYTGDGITITRN